MLNSFLVPLSGIRGGASGARARLSKSAAVLAKDLELLSSLYLARFIVWRELRRRRGQARL
jgi:hypothetical protein